MKYFVVRCFSVEDLEKEVNRRLKLGWKLVGGVAIEGTRKFDFYQAMTLKE